MSGSADDLSGADISARNIDALSVHFPACATNLHRTLRRDAHLKHMGRLQYSLFLKGVGLSLDESLTFWRTAFHKITDDTFNKDYRYNVRHVYGDVGGDQNRRGGGYSPFSCQKILLENAPSPGGAHGCPYRHFGIENLETLLQGMGVVERGVLRGVKEDRDGKKFHLACNRWVISFFFCRGSVSVCRILRQLGFYGVYRNQPISILTDLSITVYLSISTKKKSRKPRTAAQ